MEAIIDIETDHRNPDEVKNIWCIVVKEVETDKVRQFKPGCFEDFKQFAKQVTKWWGHNILAYDMPILKRLLGLDYDHKSIQDTLIYSRLLWSDRQRHSLESWGEQFGYPKIDFKDFRAYSEEMLQYCVNDVQLTSILRTRIVQKLPTISKFSANLEHKIAHILIEQEKAGFFLDYTTALSLKIKIKKKLKRLDSVFKNQLEPDLSVFVPKVNNKGRGYTKDVPVFRELPFNPGSPAQRLRLLENWWKPYIRTKAGNPKMCEENLETLTKDAPESVKALATWVKLNSRVLTIQGWFEAYKSDRRVHGKVFHIGCWTHRMSHSSPNMANIPGTHDKKGRVAPYGHEMRDVWTTPSVVYSKVQGYSDLSDTHTCIVGADADGIQLRILAHHINNPKFTAMVTGDKSQGKDIHTFNQRILQKYNCKTRAQAKTFIYAWLLGASPKKIAEILGCSLTQAKQAIKDFVVGTPGLKKFLAQVERSAEMGYMVGLDGRRVPVPSLHLSKATYLQSGEAIVMKLSYILWYTKAKEKGIWFKPCSMVHDEFQTETYTYKAKELGSLIVNSFEEAGRILKLNVPIAGGYSIGPSWAYTH